MNRKNPSVTVLKTGLCKVSQVKTTSTDGYTLFRYMENKLTNYLNPSKGRDFRSFGELPGLPEDYTVGQVVNLDNFSAGQKIRVTGTSIGKGFAGNQKRHNFSRGPMTHGSKNHRLPGSIGAGSTPGRVYPGKKMAGQMGNKKVTLKNTEIVFVNSEENIIVLKGSVPGKKNAVLKLQPHND